MAWPPSSRRRWPSHVDIARHRTALERQDLSRPIKCALADGVLSSGMTFMDYGCGRGGDVRYLRGAGFDCSGWDPVHAPNGNRRRSAVVNLGYVVNVIERPIERVEVLRRAWELTEQVLIVSARLVDEMPARSPCYLEDGVLTRLGTFQKFFEQQELRTWVDTTLDVRSVAAAPGVFYVFRDEVARSSFAAGRFRRKLAMPRIRLTEQLAMRYRDLLDGLAQFLAKRGRLPEEGELEWEGQLVDKFGSVRRAFRCLRAESLDGEWDRVREERSEDLKVYLALTRFEGRPKLSGLPLEMQRDIKAFFGSYVTACRKADEHLYALGDQETLRAAGAMSPIGKLLPTALYVHVASIDALPITLRLYEGCARATLGAVDGATIVKLGRDEPKVSYLSYPDFDRVAHPTLAESVSLHLQTFRTRTRRYDTSRNPPILHRKEAFVAPGYPRRELFERLTVSEERHGLFSDTSLIGTRDGWQHVLSQAGFMLRGHKLVKCRRRSGPSPRVN